MHLVGKELWMWFICKINKKRATAKMRPRVFLHYMKSMLC